MCFLIRIYIWGFSNWRQIKHCQWFGKMSFPFNFLKNYFCYCKGGTGGKGQSKEFDLGGKI